MTLIIFVQNTARWIGLPLRRLRGSHTSKRWSGARPVLGPSSRRGSPYTSGPARGRIKQSGADLSNNVLPERLSILQRDGNLENYGGADNGASARGELSGGRQQWACNGIKWTYNKV